MANAGAEWWGGALADGSLIVLSPSGSALFVGDSSSQSGLQPGAGKTKTSSVREWFGTRTGVPFPYDKEGHSIGLRRGTLVLGVVLLFAAMYAVNVLVEKVLHSSSTDALGIFAIVSLGTVTWILLLLMVYALDVAPLKRRGVRFISMEEDDDDYLRYVHPSVSSTPDWKTLADVANKFRPPSEKSTDIHSLLWDASGIKPTLDTGEIRPRDKARLTEMALLARGL